MATERALLRRFGTLAVHLGSFAITLVICSWVLHTRYATAVSAAIIVGATVLIVPASLAARHWLDREPTPRRIHVATFFLHWVLMILIGAALVEAIKTGPSWRGWTLPLPPGIGWTLMWITGVAGLLCVLNLAVRGLGAPWSFALSRRLATDWLYRWTRNPMGLAFVAFLAAFGLWIQSVLFVAWAVLLMAPAWLLFVKIFEERELELRFGEGYRSYRARTPMFIPGFARRRR
jgi:protein-S-isoprenylcysteine O-methyltransferase Ste14